MKQLKNTDNYIPYMAYPKFLFNIKLSVTAKLVYALLYDRAGLSKKNSDYIDESGNVFVIFTISELSNVIGKSEMTVKSSLKALEDFGLIKRKRTGIGKPSHIYIFYSAEKSEDTERKSSLSQKDSYTSCRQKIVDGTDKKLSGNYYINNNKLTTECNNSTYGKFSNVILSNEDIKALQSDIPKWREYIEKLSSYMKSNNRQYSNHAAVIRQWALKDGNVIIKTDYSGGEEDCI